MPVDWRATMADFSTRVTFGVSLLVLAGSISGVMGDDEFSPPASYYAGATGTGSALKSQLASAMSAGHTQRSYGDFRSSARYHDTDPNNANNILLTYNRASVSRSWDSGATWNREHVWPQSRQPGSASNSTRGNLGDPHSLLPCNPSINSSRGNKPFGNVSSSGNFGSQGSFYFPGDTDKGDIARSLFYSATRYSSSGLTLVNGFPSGNQMGDLASLITWHFTDAPDTFERRRNHVIYQNGANPSFSAGNRNAYIDRPEFAWSVFMDQENDTTLWLGDLEPADGASSVDVNMSVLVGDSIAPMQFTLNKSGNDGTYYEVEASEGLSSSVEGRFNAFAMSPVNLSRSITVSVDSDVTDSIGAFSGDVNIDNLDVTTQGGTGNGANDVNDMVFVNIDVYNPTNGSFEGGADTNELSIDLGTVSMGSGGFSQSFEFFNIADGGVFGAPMDVELISSSGDTGVITTDFVATNSIESGESAGFEAMISDAAEGEYSASFTFLVYNDRGLFGSLAAADELILDVSGVVSKGGCPVDFAEPMGELDFFDVSAFLDLFGAQDAAADLTGDGEWDFFDVSAFLDVFGAGCP